MKQPDKASRAAVRMPDLLQQLELVPRDQKCTVGGTTRPIAGARVRNPGSHGWSRQDEATLAMCPSTTGPCSVETRRLPRRASLKLLAAAMHSSRPVNSPRATALVSSVTWRRGPTQKHLRRKLRVLCNTGTSLECRVATAQCGKRRRWRLHASAGGSTRLTRHQTYPSAAGPPYPDTITFLLIRTLLLIC